MHISVFCGASLPHSEQITEAARQLGRAIARGGGGRVVGVIPTFFSDDIIHSQPVSDYDGVINIEAK